MTDTFSFKCSKCDQLHTGIPSFNLEAPALFYGIPEKERESRTFLTSDTCVADNEYYFAKGFLVIPVEGLEDPLTFTSWVSLSEANFYKFQESLDVANASEYGSMFGWFSSQIDGFGDCLGLKTNLILQDNNYRPEIDIEPTEHTLSLAHHHGISQDKLVTLVEGYLHKR